MEKLLDLFNLLWFERGVLEERLTETLSAGNEAGSVLDRPALKVSHVRSSSDQLTLSTNSNLLSDAESPKSVLRRTPKLQTIFSGKEVGVGFVEFEAAEEVKVERRVKRSGRRRRRRRSGGSKSLTELEFEEVKGFMDLGFVFCDEDHNDSSLVSMIPGLHRPGHHHNQNCREDAEGVGDDHLSGVSRPYLSEAWGCGSKEMKPSLRAVVGLGAAAANEVEMKNQIKSWAHSVASAVR
uniref:Uncharacterized protein n=1 Tax=Kalanchoe fedtschenkoi TaxID=63787 RepID=A0A7N0RJW7_KALFE